jgi:hypothetical protein
MPILNSAYPTLLDQAKTLDPNGSTARFVELLKASNPILEDMVAIEGNLPGGHRSTVETSLPPAYWRSYNQGVIPGKGTTAQIDEQAAMLEAWTIIDAKLANFGGNKAQFSMQKGRMQLEGMNQEMASTLIYGNAGVSPSEFTGFMPRMSSLTAGNSQNVINAGGTGGDNASILVIRWGDGVHGFFPKGSSAGVKHFDLGEQMAQNANGVTGALMKALVDQWTWDIGLATPDWRHMVRICNIDVSNLTSNTTPADLIELLEHALECLPLGDGRDVIYMNRTVGRFLRKQVRENVTSGGGLTFDNVAGKRVMFFDDVPVRRLDCMLNAETVVT